MKDVLALSVAERIQLVEDIWDTIAASGETVPVSDALREELDRGDDDIGGDADPSFPAGRRLCDHRRVDSDPDAEYQETVQKSMALRRAAEEAWRFA